MKTNLKPLTCEKARELMFDYIDGELRAGDRLRLETHIAECEVCKSELAERSEMLNLIASCGETPPSELKSCVMDKIENVPRESPAGRLRARLVPAGALTAAAAAVMILVIGRGFIFGGAMNDAKSDMEAHRHLMADEYAAPEMAYKDAEAGNASGFTADAADEIGAADMVNSSVSAAPAEKVTEAETAEEYVYATTTSLKASSPGYGLLFGTPEAYIATNSTADKSAADKSAAAKPALEPVDIEASKTLSVTDAAAHSPIDAMFEKMRTGERAILVCAADDIKLPEGEHSIETVSLGMLEFVRVTVEDGAMTLLSELLQTLEADEVQYRAAVPEGDLTGLDIFMLTESEN